MWMAVLLFLVAIVAFFVAMLGYVALLLKLKRPVYFFDLPDYGRCGYRLAWCVYWIWGVSVSVALIGVALALVFIE